MTIKGHDDQLLTEPLTKLSDENGRSNAAMGSEGEVAHVTPRLAGDSIQVARACAKNNLQLAVTIHIAKSDCLHWRLQLRKVLQAVASCYKLLQAVTSCYKLAQAGTSSYKLCCRWGLRILKSTCFVHKCAAESLRNCDLDSSCVCAASKLHKHIMQGHSNRG